MTGNFNLINLFTGGDIMIVMTSVTLVIGSVISWFIIVEKIRLWMVEKHRPSKLSRRDNMANAVENIVRPFDKNLWFLSMASIVAPFIGLFGTVWGVIMVFSAIGVTQSTSIGVVAPGLAAALGTTALGLIVAIPAAIAYQYFSKKSDALYDELDLARQQILAERENNEK